MHSALCYTQGPVSMRSVVAFGQKCSLLSDDPAKTPKEGQVAAKRLMGKQKNPQGGGKIVNCVS